MFPAGLLQIVFVIAVINTHLAMINFEDAVDETAQEVAVMADEHNRAGKILQRGQQCFAIVNSLLKWRTGIRTTPLLQADLIPIIFRNQLKIIFE